MMRHLRHVTKSAVPTLQNQVKTRPASHYYFLAIFYCVVLVHVVSKSYIHLFVIIKFFVFRAMLRSFHFSQLHALLLNTSLGAGEAREKSSEELKEKRDTICVLQKYFIDNNKYRSEKSCRSVQTLALFCSSSSVLPMVMKMRNGGVASEIAGHAAHIHHACCPTSTQNILIWLMVDCQSDLLCHC